MSLKTYRKKPVEILAYQWNYRWDAEALEIWIEDFGGRVTYCPDTAGPSDPQTGEDWGLLEIETLEGTMTVTPRDYIIQGVQGEFYPCKPDIFAATYEGVMSPTDRIGDILGTEDEVGMLELERPPRDESDYHEGFAAGYAWAEHIVREALEG